MVAVGWLDNKAVNFISTSDTTAISSVMRRVGSEKKEVPAPAVVCNYNKYMGGVDRHDKLRSTFSLGKRHKFRKYYVKLVLFLVDVALTNAWIYYKMANENVGEKYGDRADFYINLAKELLRDDIDFEAKYKVNTTRRLGATRRTNNCDSEESQGESNGERSDTNADSGIDGLIMPNTTHFTAEERAGVERFLRMGTASETCRPCSFSAFPFPLKKRSKSCQVCQYELKKPKWKDVVICPLHKVRLCLSVQPPRSLSLPALIKRDGSDVTDYSWTCEETASCWDKFHTFYSKHGLFSSKNIDLNQKKIKFGAVQYSSELYQKKYTALGIEITKKGKNSKGVGLIVAAKHWKT